MTKIQNSKRKIRHGLTQIARIIFSRERHPPSQSYFAKATQDRSYGGQAPTQRKNKDYTATDFTPLEKDNARF